MEINKRVYKPVTNTEDILTEKALEFYDATDPLKIYKHVYDGNYIVVGGFEFTATNDEDLNAWFEQLHDDIYACED